MLTRQSTHCRFDDEKSPPFSATKATTRLERDPFAEFLGGDPVRSCVSEGGVVSGDLCGPHRWPDVPVTSHGRGLQRAVAAVSISCATSAGFESITTCEAPFTTTVCRELARSAMNANACGGMFLS